MADQPDLYNNNITLQSKSSKLNCAYYHYYQLKRVPVVVVMLTLRLRMTAIDTFTDSQLSRYSSISCIADVYSLVWRMTDLEYLSRYLINSVV